MDIRNRMADVVKLRCNLCQEYLRLVLVPGWQEIVYKQAEEAVRTKNRVNDYIAAYEKMRDVGIDNYSVYDMDVSFIVVIVCYVKAAVNVNKEIEEALKRIKNDRNLTDHSDENEEPSELYLRALLSLRDLRDFVRLVDKKEISRINDDERMRYRADYIKKIDELQNTIDDERIVYIQKKKERKANIDRILNDERSNNIWLEVIQYYFSRRKFDGNFDEYIQFIKEASEAGVIQAYPYAADYYYNNKEYNMAENYFYYIYKNQDLRHEDPRQIMKLADIYFRGLSERKGDGEDVISALKACGREITESADGKWYEYRDFRIRRN